MCWTPEGGSTTCEPESTAIASTTTETAATETVSTETVPTEAVPTAFSAETTTNVPENNQAAVTPSTTAETISPSTETAEAVAPAAGVSMSELRQNIADSGTQGMNGYQTSLANVKNNLKEGESAVVLVNGDHYALVTKEPGNKFGVTDANVNDGKKVIYSGAEFNNLMSGKDASGVDGDSGNDVTTRGNAVDANNVQVLTNSKGISQTAKAGDGRSLNADEMDAARGTGAEAVIPQAAGQQELPLVTAQSTETTTTVATSTESKIMPEKDMIERGQFLQEYVPPASAEPRKETYFAFDSSGLSSISRENIRKFAESVKGKEYNITIEGFTDAVGTREYNMKLSLQRANAVKAELVRNGLDPDRIETIGHGKDRPITSNKTALGRARNRRTVMFAEIGD